MSCCILPEVDIQHISAGMELKIGWLSQNFSIVTILRGNVHTF